MELKVIRELFTGKSTIGSLEVNGNFECFTLEDVPRKVKVKSETAIPEGRYQVIIDKSVRFGVMMPLLVNVPGFAGVRIHPGNTNADTDGCILLGQTKAKDFIGNSKKAYKAFFAKLDAALKNGEKAFLTIVTKSPMTETALA